MINLNFLTVFTYLSGKKVEKHKKVVFLPIPSEVKRFWYIFISFKMYVYHCRAMKDLKCIIFGLSSDVLFETLLEAIFYGLHKSIYTITRNTQRGFT